MLLFTFDETERGYAQEFPTNLAHTHLCILCGSITAVIGCSQKKMKRRQEPPRSYNTQNLDDAQGSLYLEVERSVNA